MLTPRQTKNLACTTSFLESSYVQRSYVQHSYVQRSDVQHSTFLQLCSNNKEPSTNEHSNSFNTYPDCGHYEIFTCHVSCNVWICWTPVHADTQNEHDKAAEDPTDCVPRDLNPFLSTGKHQVLSLNSIPFYSADT